MKCIIYVRNLKQKLIDGILKHPIDVCTQGNNHFSFLIYYCSQAYAELNHCCMRVATLKRKFIQLNLLSAKLFTILKEALKCALLFFPIH